MTPWLADADVTLYHGDVLQVLRELPAESVDCCVTSPPYWGLRDYGTGAWEGGDAGCDHRVGGQVPNGSQLNPSIKRDGSIVGGVRPGVDASVCLDCGATRIDQQLGLEPTPEEYVTRMVEVFREVRRVLAAHGTVWLNLGDSYAATTKGSGGLNSTSIGSGRGQSTNAGSLHDDRSWQVPPGLKPKDLVGIPWRVAFALQADGWYLRSDIIWAKPNPMPESVTDRPTKSHEFVFLLSKNPRYFFDQEAVREPHSHDGRTVTTVLGQDGSIQHRDGERWPNGGRNIRTVWDIATQPYPEAHFATFPEELARRCIAAGTSERGKCPECGAPWVRVVGRDVQPEAYADRKYDRSDPKFATKRNMGARYQKQLDANPMQTIGWKPSCRCYDKRHRMAEAVDPAVVLDPFMGSGTVAYVARKLGRHAVGIDLNETYLELAARRLQQQSLFAEAASGL